MYSTVHTEPMRKFVMLLARHTSYAKAGLC